MQKFNFINKKMGSLCTLFFILQEGLAPLKLCVEEEFDRASRGGTGGIKSITNYAPVRESFSYLVCSFINWLKNVHS